MPSSVLGHPHPAPPDLPSGSRCDMQTATPSSDTQHPLKSCLREAVSAESSRETSQEEMLSPVPRHPPPAPPDRRSGSRCGMQTLAPSSDEQCPLASTSGSDAQRPVGSCLRNADDFPEMSPDSGVNDTPHGGRQFGKIRERHERDEGALCVVATEATRSDRPKVKEKESAHVGPIKPKQRTAIKKKVCFADSKGFDLATVRVADGPSETPPRLMDRSLFEEVVQDEQAKPTPLYTYIPDFEQPSAEYLDFRNRLERDMVCLENLVIRDNLSLMGTVKVRNIAYTKSVTVRVTFDEWRTYRDVPASYVYPEAHGPTRGEHTVAPDKYDTFEFRFELPPNQGERPTNFCVRYTCDGSGPFWDNNGGENYRIVSLRSHEASEHEKMLAHYRSLSGSYPWSEVHFHSLDSEKERPYW